MEDGRRHAVSPHNGKLSVGATDPEGLDGQEDDYAFFKRVHRDRRGQHLKNLLDRLCKSAA